MSLEDPEDLPDPEGLADDEYAGGWCVTAIVGITTPEGECTVDPSVEVELTYDHPPTRSEMVADLLDEVAPWAASFFSSPTFRERFGPNPALCLVGEAIYRC